jgi:hypothetical protein
MHLKFNLMLLTNTTWTCTQNTELLLCSCFYKLMELSLSLSLALALSLSLSLPPSLPQNMELVLCCDGGAGELSAVAS